VPGFLMRRLADDERRLADDERRLAVRTSAAWR
jgi:hypothetical protein